MGERVRVAPPWVRGGKKHGFPRTVVRRTGTTVGHTIRIGIGTSITVCTPFPAEGMTPEEVAEYDKGYDGETGEKVWFEPEPQMEDEMTKIIEAEYQVMTTQFWEVKHIEAGPPTMRVSRVRFIRRAISTSNGGCCMCSGTRTVIVFEYEPTAEDNGDGMDYKWPDAEYIDGELMA